MKRSAKIDVYVEALRSLLRSIETGVDCSRLRPDTVLESRKIECDVIKRLRQQLSVPLAKETNTSHLCSIATSLIFRFPSTQDACSHLIVESTTYNEALQGRERRSSDRCCSHDEADVLPSAQSVQKQLGKKTASLLTFAVEAHHVPVCGYICRKSPPITCNRIISSSEHSLRAVVDLAPDVAALRVTALCYATT